jgi:hypothetical protein
MVVVPLMTSWGEVAEPLVVGASMAAEQGEGLGHVELAALGEDALGLIDDRLAVQGGLQLLGEDLAAADGAFLQDAAVATSASACPMRRSSAESPRGRLLNRLSAPMVSECSRSGSACTAR